MGKAVVVDSDELLDIKNELLSLKSMISVLLSNPKQPYNGRLMSIPAAAQEIGIDKRTLIKAINDGLINYTPTSNSGQKRLHPDEVQRFKTAYQNDPIEIRRGRKPASSNFATN